MGSQEAPMGDLGQHGGSNPVVASDSSAKEAEEDLKVIEWEDFQNSLAHFCGLTSVNTKLRAKREALAQKLEAALEVRKESLQRIDELEAMKRKLKLREFTLENAKVSLQERSEDVAIAKDKLIPSIRSLLVAAGALGAAHTRLQEADRLLGGEGGHGRLSHLRKLLGARRRLMVTQVAALYPLAPCSTTVSSSLPQKHSTISVSQSSGFIFKNKVLCTSDSSNKECQFINDAAVDKLDTIPMTIGGLHVLAPLNKKPGLYNEKNDYEGSATALGYVAHVVSLVASFVDVPLRYPVRFGASRSYIQDYAPAVESVAAESGMNTVGSSLGGTRKSITEFPLFSEGQDPTRSAYAVFLLNKDLEQMLNYWGAESVGPRHTLPNLNKLIQLICSGACTVA